MATTQTSSKNAKNAPVPESEHVEGFDPSTLPRETLDGGDFEPIVGFVITKGDDVQYPIKLEGMIDGVIAYNDKRAKREKNWYAIVATKDQSILFYDSENDKRGSVKKGMRLGLSETGALRKLANKNGHYVWLTWTGKKIDTGNSQPMWEVLVECSKEPLPHHPITGEVRS
jgi:hypothetical protein